MTGANLSPADMSHAMLVAILMHHGGSIDLPASAFEPDALGGPDGAWHAVGMEPQTDGTVRITVHPRPDVDQAGMTTY
ncbi:head-tail adaptor protein [Streptomyces tendae]|uniref:pRL2-19 n=1 Tax=Streptomyces tendae TaxID=1932 RepID=UPI0036B4D972